MNTALIWVLSITVLGPVPEHKTFAKYKTKQECEQALEQSKAEYVTQKKKVSATCTVTMKQYPYDGPDLVSTGQRVTEWTAQQAMTVNQAKLVNANASTFEYYTVEGFTADDRVAA